MSEQLSQVYPFSDRVLLLWKSMSIVSEAGKDITQSDIDYFEAQFALRLGISVIFENEFNLASVTCSCCDKQVRALMFSIEQKDATALSLLVKMNPELQDIYPYDIVLQERPDIIPDNIRAFYPFGINENVVFQLVEEDETIVQNIIQVLSK